MKKISTLLFGLILISSFGYAKSAKTATYKIQSGDTLFTIARKHHTTIAEVQQANSLKKGENLKIGRTLKVPTNTYFPDKKNKKSKTVTANKNPKPANYKIQNGDTLFTIARKHHTTIAELQQANSLKKGESLKIGRTLKVPTSTYFPDKKNIASQATSKKKEEKIKVVSAEKSKKSKMVSSKKPTKAKSTKLTNYKIQSGDTLFMIARQHHTTVEEVRQANHLKKGENLKVGRALKVPNDTYFSGKKKSEAVKLASAAKTEKKVNRKTKKSALPVEKSISYKVRKGDSLYSIAKKHDTTVDKLKKANKIKSNKSLRVGQLLALPGTKTNSAPTVKLAKNNKKINTPAAKKSASKKVAKKPKSAKKHFFAFSSGSKKQKAIPKEAKKYLGKRYVWGATGPYRFDCSGFTSYVCKKNGVCLPRTSAKQSKVGKRVSRRSLKPGDLVFFDTSKRRRGYINHVGIYIGNNKFIHASSAKRKVVITSLNKPFYKSRFKWGRRI